MISVLLALRFSGDANRAFVQRVIGILIENIAEVTRWRKRWRSLEKLQKIVENRTSDVEVPLRLVEKNVLLALAAAGAARPRLPILNQIAVTWAEVAPNFAEADISALYLALQRL
jgi:3-hydroxyisobutyrate dehydrogenase-like beta-hydroxyacid dehydrogenase